MRVSRSLVLALVLAVSPLGAALCAVVCAMPAPAMAAMDLKHAASGRHVHHGMTADTEVPRHIPTTGHRVTSAPETCQPTTTESARVKPASPDLGRNFERSVVAVIDLMAPLTSSDLHDPVGTSPPGLLRHQSSIPLRI